MTIDTEKLRALLAAATPGPWRKWAQHESTRCVWKDTLPLGSTCIESTGTVFALGVAVAATTDDGPDAALIAAAVNALPELLDALATAEQALAKSREKVGNQRAQLRRFNRDGQAISDALIGSMYEKSRLLKEKTRALATAEAERLTLARALRTGNGHLDQAASELAARIVAEADAEVRRG